MEDTWNNNESKKYIGEDIYPQNIIFSKLFSINYFLILYDDDNNDKSDLLLEMQSNLQKSQNFFAFFSFIKLSKREKPNLLNENYYYVNDYEPFFDEYFLFCFEGNCYIFYTKAKDFKKNLQSLFEINKKVLLIGSSNDDIARYQEIFNINEENTKKSDAKSMENKFILLNEKSEINEIENDVNTIMNEPIIIGLNNQLKKSNQTIYDIIKLISFRIIMTYSIRRFYFPINSFSDPSFFLKEKDFLDKTEKKYTNVSYLNNKYKPQMNIQMKEMNIKDFIILRSIGKGSCATIYLAFHIYEEQLFVIKKFKDSACFEKEKNNYLKLNYYHPNIIKCYGFTNNSLIIEFMSNGTLQKLIKIKTIHNSYFAHFVSPFVLYSTSDYFHDLKVDFFNNRVNKIKMIIEIIFGLEYLHLNDMIYCDMKPDNIFIDHNFMIRLGDFDLSCNCDFLSSKSNKVGNIDSVNYFSPDISLNEKGYYTYISDIFQLGLIIYAICKGDDLFQNVSIESTSQINKYIKNKSIPFLYGPFCSFFIDCLKTQPINRKNLCKIIVELSDNQQFFTNLIKENHCNFYYTDIVEELHLLHQNLYKILFGFINSFSEEIINQNNKKRNIRQYEFVLNHLFFIPSLKNMRNYLTEEIQTIINYCENQIRNTKDKNKRIELLKNQFYRTLYFIYSDKNYGLYNIHKSSEYLLLGVKNKDTLSQNILALKFFDGDEIFKKDLHKSILFFTLSADSGSENAQYNLGEIYTNLYGSPIRLTIPQLNIDTNDQIFFANQALKYYKLAKKQNKSAALYALSAIYNNGELGLNKNKRKAISYLIRSKNHFYQVSINSFLTFFSVGLIYSNYDIGTFEKEATFLSDSFGNVVAQYELGNFYLKQVKNIEKAKKYFKMACDQNHRTAITSLANIYLEESKRNNSIELEKESFKYFLHAANLNEPTALFYVACRYFHGDRSYIMVDKQKALDFFQRAFVLNSPKAQYFLGYIYFKGCKPYVEPNIKKAIYCFNLAANNPIRKEKDAMDILGLIYLEGKVVIKDVNLSLKYFKNAKNLRSQLSAHQLGFLYEVGEKRLLNNLYLIQNDIFSTKFQIYMLNFSYIDNLDELEQNDDSTNLKIMPDLAIQYYKESFSPPSLYNLAAIYYSGIYVKRDVLLAIDLLSKIAKYVKFAAFFLFRIFSTGEPNLVKVDGKKAAYYLNLSGISPLNCNLTIDVLKNSRFSYQMIYYINTNAQSNKAQNIDINFYEGLLKPRIEDPNFDNLYNYHPQFK